MLLKKILSVCLLISLSSVLFVTHGYVFDESSNESDIFAETSENYFYESETDTESKTGIVESSEETSVTQYKSSEETSVMPPESSEEMKETSFEASEEISEEASEEYVESKAPESIPDKAPLSRLDTIYSNMNSPQFIGFYGTERPYLIIINICGQYTFSTFTNPEKFTYFQSGNMTDVHIDTHRDNPDGTKTLWIGGGWEIYIVGENFTVDGRCWQSIDTLPHDVMDYCPALLSPLY